MGYEVTRFQGDVDEELICPICSSVLQNPLQVQVCEHTFCKECILEWISRQPTCPVDRQRITLTQLRPVPRIIKNLLSRLVIACENVSYGCSQLVKLDVLESHLDTCEHNPKRPVPCEQGCGLVIPVDELKDHNCVRELRTLVQSYQQKMAEFQQELADHRTLVNNQKRELHIVKEFVYAMRMSNPAVAEQLERKEVIRWSKSLPRARVLRWGGMISTPDENLQELFLLALTSITEDADIIGRHHAVLSALRCLQICSPAERTMLKALLELISNLGGDGPALLTLADFFAPSLVGVTSVRRADERLRDVRFLLLFLCCHWTAMFAILGADALNCLPEGITHGVCSSLSQPTSLGERLLAGSSKIEGRKSVSCTDARPKRPLVPRIFKQLYAAAENKCATTSSVVSVASATTPTDETPLLWNPDAQEEENVADFPSRRKSVSQSCVTTSIESTACKEEKSQSRCWLKSLFSSRGSSMSSIPPLISVKYEPIPDKKQTWTL